ncbi:hypothetical protein BW36_01387 [Micrococcus luteus]|nr:hypothetical protein BW36_01387 [Micrococcus luteus]
MADPAYPYRFPTLSDAPRRLVDAQRTFFSLAPEDMAERIGVYCEESSHAGDPWPIGSLALSPEVRERTGRDWWTLLATFAVGTGQRLDIAGNQAQLLVGDRRVPTDDWGNPDLTHGSYADSRSRYRMECGRCGLALTARQETLQRVAEKIHAAGLREVTLGVLAASVHRVA